MSQMVAGEGVHFGDLLHLITEEGNAYDGLLVCGVDLYGVPLHPELPAAERHVISLVLHADELAQYHPLLDAASLLKHQELPLVVLRGSEPVDTRNRRDDDRVPAGQEGCRGRVAKTVYLVVDRRVLLDERVA